MIIWTIIPPETLFGVANEISPNIEVNYDGNILEVQQLSESECSIQRIITTRPDDYLRPELQPGRVLAYHQVSLKNTTAVN